MKTDSIQYLLEKYREGTLSEGEREELNRLTHRDEVMAAASERAHGIVFRRRIGIGLATLVLVVGGAITWSQIPRTVEAPLVAETTVPETISLPEPTVEQAISIDQAPPIVHTHQTKPKRIQATATTPIEEPVVICNNQCEADSVISDIWKFLTV